MTNALTIESTYFFYQYKTIDNKLNEFENRDYKELMADTKSKVIILCHNYRNSNFFRLFFLSKTILFKT
jgi:hypothetical protein